MMFLLSTTRKIGQRQCFRAATSRPPRTWLCFLVISQEDDRKSQAWGNVRQECVVVDVSRKVNFAGTFVSCCQLICLPFKVSGKSFKNHLESSDRYMKKALQFLTDRFWRVERCWSQAANYGDDVSASSDGRLDAQNKSQLALRITNWVDLLVIGALLRLCLS